MGLAKPLGEQHMQLNLFGEGEERGEDQLRNIMEDCISQFPGWRQNLQVTSNLGESENNKWDKPFSSTTLKEKLLVRIFGQSCVRRETVFQ